MGDMESLVAEQGKSKTGFFFWCCSTPNPDGKLHWLHKTAVSESTSSFLP
jgi:hypothetical protein